MAISVTGVLHRDRNTIDTTGPGLAVRAAGTGVAVVPVVSNVGNAFVGAVRATGAASTGVPAPTGSVRAFATASPPTTADADVSAVSLGVEFYTDLDSTVSAVQFWQPATGGSAATRTVGIYRASDGVLMGSTQTLPVVGSGWQTAVLPSPVAVARGVQYRAVVYHPAGGYAATSGYFTAGGLGSADEVLGVLHVPNNTDSLNGQGLYIYGTGIQFPTSTFGSANYWTDFTLSAGPVGGGSYLATGRGAARPPFVSGSSTGGGTTPDSWGGFWPDATNTGVPAGTTLTAYTGPTTITVPGTIIDSKKITSQIIIQADNVTIRKCLIQGPLDGQMILNDAFSAVGGLNLMIVDCELDAQNHYGNDCAVGTENYTLLRCNVHGTGDGLKVGTNTVIQDSWIHDMAWFSAAQTGTGDQTHNDCCQCLDTISLTITHNTLIMVPNGNSALTLSTGVSSNMRNILFQRNLVAGGGFTIFGGYQAGVDDLSRVSNIQFLDNRFSTVQYVTSGVFGPWTSVSPPVVLTGNLWWDGPNAGTAV